ncbi:MAG: hypothetical protein RBU30_11420 [Polyangia bacterium]|jgi:hypothetical protein|nr:hypothetical protein [Polyangia bacterium]
MKLVPLEPDPRYGRLGQRIAVGGVLLLALTTIPLARLQLGEAGWSVLGDDLGPLLWPLGALAALGAAGLLGFALWLYRRPQWAPLLLVVPSCLTLVGICASLAALPGAGTPGEKALAELAASTAAPAWALSLSAALAAGAALTLGSVALARARTLAVPWGLLLILLGGLLLVTSFSQWARMPPRPLTLTVLGAAWLGPLLATAPWASQAPPARSEVAGAALPVALLSALLAGLSASLGDDLVLRAAALYAQGPDPQSHAQALALGGARAPTARLLSSAIPILTTILVVILAGHGSRGELRAADRRSRFRIAAALLLVALSVGAIGWHRHALTQAVRQADRQLSSNGPPAETVPPAETLPPIEPPSPQVPPIRG